MKPTWRKPFGIFVMLFIIAVWSMIILSVSDFIGSLNQWLQLVIYIFAGIVWIAPMGPLMLWMETGSFRKPDDL